jgi:hypothetical protein
MYPPLINRPELVLRGRDGANHPASAFVGRGDHPSVGRRRAGLDLLDAALIHLCRDFLAFRGVLEGAGERGVQRRSITTAGENGAGFMIITSWVSIASSAKTSLMNFRQSGSASIALRRASRSARLS